MGPRLVYRPTNSTRATRRRLRRGLHADWIAAREPPEWVGRSAAALGLGRQRITVFRNEDRAAWDEVVARLRQLDAPVSGSSTPASAAGERSQAPSTSEPEPARRAGMAGAGSDARRHVSDLPRPVFPTEPAPTVAETPAPAPRLLAVGVAAPASPGHPWWMYRRMDVPAAARAEALRSEGAGPPPPSGPPAGAGPPSGPGPDARAGRPVQLISTPTRSGVGALLLRRSRARRRRRVYPARHDRRGGRPRSARRPVPRSRRRPPDRAAATGGGMGRALARPGARSRSSSRRTSTTTP